MRTLRAVEEVVLQSGVLFGSVGGGGHVLRVAVGVGVGLRVGDFGGFAVGADAEGVEEADEDGGGCGEDYVAGYRLVVSWRRGR